MSSSSHVVLSLSCTDGVGIVAAVSGYVASRRGWIVESAHFSDGDSGQFFMREEIALPADVTLEDFSAGFETISSQYTMNWKLAVKGTTKRIAVMVSKDEHCIYDLLGRQRAGELAGTIAVVISNHELLRDVVESHGLAFVHIPVGDDKEDVNTAFSDVAGVLNQFDVHTVVLARYMQVLPQWLCNQFEGRIINIHHSFLPSFKGARPYHQAHERGVKLIGATCHYVTADLDEGPIIEQDVVRIDHADATDELRKAGKDIEKAVLARGLRWHLEDRVFLNQRRTVVFR